MNVSLSSRNKVQAITCLQDDQTTTRIDCKQLLLACGPWTPSVYEKLFPASPVRLHWTTDAGDWVLFKNPCPTTCSTVAFISFAGLIGEKFEFAGRDDGTIWACGRRNLTAVLPSPGHLDKPDESLIEDLSRRARKWLNWGCACTDKHHEDFQIVSKGRAFRPMAESGLPVISEAASSDLNSLAVDETIRFRNAPAGYSCVGVTAPTG